MKAVIVARGPTQNHQHSWGAAFAEGLRRHGWEADLSPVARPCDLLVLWGVRNRAAIAGATGEVCILERGYLGDRFAWTSVSFGGGLNGRGEFRGVRDDPERFEVHHGALADWRRTKGYALIMGQVPGDMSLMRAKGSLTHWYSKAARALEAKGWDVRFRPHPQTKGRETVAGVRTLGGTLEQALAGAGLVVTWNSNAAVDAVVCGVPAVSMDEGSMAWPVTAHDYKVTRPRREKWAARLAWKQWRMDEMRSGECWEAVSA